MIRRGSASAKRADPSAGRPPREGRVAHRQPRQRLADEVLASLAGTGDLGGGSRTTLRVPEALERELAPLSRELGLTRNETLVRLALVGARIVRQARTVEATREARLEAVFAAAGGSPAAAELPGLGEMQEAALALRNAGP